MHGQVRTNTLSRASSLPFQAACTPASLVTHGSHWPGPELWESLGPRRMAPPEAVRTELLFLPGLPNLSPSCLWVRNLPVHTLYCLAFPVSTSAFSSPIPHPPSPATHTHPPNAWRPQRSLRPPSPTRNPDCPGEGRPACQMLTVLPAEEENYP